MHISNYYFNPNGHVMITARAFAVVLLATLLSHATNAVTVTGAARVIDGDTIEIDTDGCRITEIGMRPTWRRDKCLKRSFRVRFIELSYVEVADAAIYPCFLSRQ
jgi:endonuclease YncB( thermonuclease family)